MTPRSENSLLPTLSDTSDGPTVHIVKGRDALLRLSSFLVVFSERCGQAGAMQDLSFFLSKPGALPRTPCLVIVSNTPDVDQTSPDLDRILGVLLVFEFRVLGMETGAIATNDRSGRSTLVARPADRASVVSAAVRALLERGAQLILISCRLDNGERYPKYDIAERLLLPVLRGDGDVARWALRNRTIPGYLPLLDTFDATLAKVGQRTRSNLRYYRRRAESRLGCRFLPQIEVSRHELIAFNRECMYAVSDEIAAWRFDSLKDLAEPVFMGVKDRDGRWLSMLGGRRYGDRSEILWQLNRDGHAADSIGTVTRSYFIEHEIARGSRRLYIEGGTPQPIRFSFVPEVLTDLAVVRRSPAARFMQRFAARYISGDNELCHMLAANDLSWLPC